MVYYGAGTRSYQAAQTPLALGAPEEEKEAKILQIMPVPPGWQAVWGDVNAPEEGEAGFTTELIACWALVEVGEQRFVTALLPDLESGELKFLIESEYFVGYSYSSEPTNWDNEQLCGAANTRTSRLLPEKACFGEDGASTSFPFRKGRLR